MAGAGAVTIIGGKVALLDARVGLGCPSTVPDACPAGLADDYYWTGYSDGDLPACASCMTEPAPGLWAGRFHRFTPLDPCIWELATDTGFSGLIGGGYIDYDAGTYSGVFVTGELTLGVGQWEVQIVCSTDAFGGEEVIWSGIKTTGEDPTGVYTRSASCAAAAGLAQIAIGAAP